MAKKLGLPINKLIVATNQNNILHRAISSGEYKAEKVVQTISPSMDIQIASNFERLIYDLNDFDCNATKKIMSEIKESGKYIISQEKIEKIKKHFLSASLNDNEVLNIIKSAYKEHKILMDPHTAIGFGAIDKIKVDGLNIVLGTAHPCKFPDAINDAIKTKPQLPKELMHILDEKEDYMIIPNDLQNIKKFIKSKSLV